MIPRVLVGVILLVSSLAFLGGAPAAAIPPDPNATPLPPPPCWANVQANFRADASQIDLNQSTTLRWNVHGCQGLSVTMTPNLGGNPIQLADARVVTPDRNTTWTLKVKLGANSKYFSARVTVRLPRDGNGRINATITSNSQADRFVEAISSNESTDATVVVQDHVALDLTPWPEIHVRPGVQIRGGRRTGVPGPLLYTTGYPYRQFVIGQYFNADNVRISGVRVRGADQSVADDDDPESIGIWIDSSVNVEIDNNEIYGWHVAAIDISDSRNRIDRANGRGAVRIHDNFIYNNQRIGDGYGVAVGAGAYALVEKNSFDNNRHAMAGDGSYGAGYFFYRNTVGTGGGHHGFWCFGWPTQWCTWSWRTHQIDMHGQDDCNGADGYCGVAGEYMDIRYNAILYNAGTTIRLRGTPTRRMDVAHNYFLHQNVWGNWQWTSGAMEQTDGDGAIVQWGNSFNSWNDHTGDLLSPCDFDGDGLNDFFLATGSTWFVTGFGQPFHYLNTSTLQLEDLDFLDVNGDGRCDVRSRADGRVSLSGRTPITALARTDILSRNTVTGSLRISRVNGGGINGQSFHAVPLDRDVVASGDFDGDGDSDVLVRKQELIEQPHGWFRQTKILLLQDGSVVGSEDWGLSPMGAAVAGVADFDGDGQSDVLWRETTGALKLWYRGVDNNVSVTYRNIPGYHVGLDWRVDGVGDFNGDGYADIAWRHDNGVVVIWLMVGSVFTGEWSPGPADWSWTIQGVGDFDADGRSDLLWRHTTGWLAISFGAVYAGGAYPTWRNQGAPTELGWQIKGVSDFNGDGRSDILWTRATDGLSLIWMMDGGSYVGESASFTIEGDWPLQGLLPAF